VVQKVVEWKGSYGTTMELQGYKMASFCVPTISLPKHTSPHQIYVYINIIRSNNHKSHNSNSLHGFFMIGCAGECYNVLQCVVAGTCKEQLSLGLMRY